MHTVRTTLNLSVELLDTAARGRPSMTKTKVIEEALKALIARDAALALAALGGSAPAARAPRRTPGGSK